MFVPLIHAVRSHDCTINVRLDFLVVGVLRHLDQVGDDVPALVVVNRPALLDRLADRTGRLHRRAVFAVFVFFSWHLSIMSLYKTLIRQFPSSVSDTSRNSLLANRLSTSQLGATDCASHPSLFFLPQAFVRTTLPVWEKRDNGADPCRSHEPASQRRRLALLVSTAREKLRCNLAAAESRHGQLISALGYGPHLFEPFNCLLNRRSLCPHVASIFGRSQCSGHCFAFRLKLFNDAFRSCQIIST